MTTKNETARPGPNRSATGFPAESPTERALDAAITAAREKDEEALEILEILEMPLRNVEELREIVRKTAVRDLGDHLEAAGLREGRRRSRSARRLGRELPRRARIGAVR